MDLDFALMVVMMSLVGGPLGGWSCDLLLEDGWVVVDGWEVHFHGGLGP